MTRRTRIAILCLIVQGLVIAFVAVAAAFVSGWRIVFVAATATAAVAVVSVVTGVMGRP